MKLEKKKAKIHEVFEHEQRRLRDIVSNQIIAALYKCEGEVFMEMRDMHRAIIAFKGLVRSLLLSSRKTCARRRA